jgi:hypothetical protein
MLFDALTIKDEYNNSNQQQKYYDDECAKNGFMVIFSTKSTIDWEIKVKKNCSFE